MNNGTLAGPPLPKIQALTEVNDRDYRCLITDRVVLYTAITTTRTVTLPNASAFGPGALVIGDTSGSCVVGKAISVNRSARDTIMTGVGGTTPATVINIQAPNGVFTFYSDGVSRWTMPGSSVYSGDIAAYPTIPENSTVVGWRGVGLDAGFAVPSEGAVPYVTGGVWSTRTDYLINPGTATYTPTLTQSGAIAKTVNRARYIQFGNLVVAWISLTPTDAAGTTNNAIIVGLPTGITSQTAGGAIGAGWITLAGVTYRVVPTLVSTTTFAFKRNDATGTGNMGVDPNAEFSNATSDTFSCFIVYEAA